jgi:protein ImuB
MDIAAAQTTLTGEPDFPDLAPLIDRLANRLGPQAVSHFELQESHLPERAVRHVRAGSTPGAARPPPYAAGWTNAAARPLRLLSRPEPIEVIAPVPDDPPILFRWRRVPHRIARADGPERIAPEWWRQRAPPRDYYRIEDAEGRRFWVFREGLYQARPLRWFLHGLFA